MWPCATIRLATLQAAELFFEFFSKQRDDEKTHVTVRAVEDCDDSDSEDSGLESILLGD